MANTVYETSRLHNRDGCNIKHMINVNVDSENNSYTVGI